MRARTDGLVGDPRPPTSTWPAVGSMMPTAMCTVVLLPAPFGPSRPKTSPLPTDSDSPSTARLVPNCFTSAVRVSMVDVTERGLMGSRGSVNGGAHPAGAARGLYYADEHRRFRLCQAGRPREHRVARRTVEQPQNPCHRVERGHAPV